MRKGRRAAIGRLFVGGILSLRLYLIVSILALSVTFGDTARVAAPSVCFAAARILLAAAPTAPPCFRRWRRSSPLLPKGEVRRRSTFRRIRHIQHRAEGVEDEASMPLATSSRFCWVKSGTATACSRSWRSQAASREQRVLAGGCGAGRELGGVKGVRCSRSARRRWGRTGPARCRHCRPRPARGPARWCSCRFRAASGTPPAPPLPPRRRAKLLLPCAVDELGGVTEAAAGGQQQGDAAKVGRGDAAVAGGDVECAGSPKAGGHRPPSAGSRCRPRSGRRG